MINEKNIFSALASEPRLKILGWLKNPEAHFATQRLCDMKVDGVCGSRIAEKLEFSLPTVSRHMKLLVDVGLVESKRIKQWTFYRRLPEGVKSARRVMRDAL